MMGLGAGGALSSGGRKLIQLAIMGGVGVTALGAYGYANPNIPGLEFVKSHQPLVIAVGVGMIALGAMVSWYFSHRMMRQMTAGFSGMAGVGLPGAAGMAGMPGMASTVVKVRCGSCKSLQDESSRFCASCGAAMA